jgi:sarcosine/dimethylglycine N-methyltransferase
MTDEGDPLISTSPVYTESDVGDFFDQTLQTYLSFWDAEGILHTGYFAGEADEDYRAAAERTSDVLAAEAGIDDAARVLDVGCGCGKPTHDAL